MSYYLGVMRRLREAIRQKRPDLWANNSWILHHDKAPSHKAIVIREHLAKKFDRLKKPLCGTRCSTRDEVMEKSKMALKAIPQTDYKKCFEDWIKRWHKCVEVDGEYFEGGNIDYDE